MRRSDRMKVVLDLAQRNENEALEVLAQARKYREAQHGQLLNLQNYHGQYMNEMKAGVGGVLSVNQLQANLQFVNQIDLAIQQQEQILKNAEAQFDQALSNWKMMHQKKKGLSDLIERYKYQESMEEDKIEQKMLEDMHSARRYRG